MRSCRILISYIRSIIKCRRCSFESQSFRKRLNHPTYKLTRREECIALCEFIGSVLFIINESYKSTEQGQSTEQDQAMELDQAAEHGSFEKAIEALTE